MSRAWLLQAVYVRGARAGRLAGFCWGVLAGALLTVGAFALGWNL